MITARIRFVGDGNPSHLAQPTQPDDAQMRSSLGGFSQLHGVIDWDSSGKRPAPGCVSHPFIPLKSMVQNMRKTLKVSKIAGVPKSS